MKVDNVTNLTGKYKKIQYADNQIEIGNIVKFENLMDDNQQVYIDIQTKDTNLNLESILNLQNQINLQRTQLNLQKIINQNQTYEINLQSQQLNQLRLLIAQNFREHDDLENSLPSWVTQFKNDYDQKILLFDELNINYLYVYDQFKRQTYKFNVDINNIYSVLEELKSVTQTGTALGLSGTILSALSLLGIIGSTATLAIWITAISTQVQANSAGIAALQSEMSVLKAALDMEDMVGDVAQDVQKVVGKIEKVAENVIEPIKTLWQKGQKIIKYGQIAYNIGSTIWQTINQDQTQDGITKLQRIEQTFEFDQKDVQMKDDLGNQLLYVKINDHLLLDKEYEFKCYDVRSKYGKIDNYDILFTLINGRLDNFRDVLATLTGQQNTSSINVTAINDYYKSSSTTSPSFDIQNFQQQTIKRQVNYNTLFSINIGLLYSLYDQQQTDLQSQLTTIQSQLTTLQTTVSSQGNQISTLQTTVSSQEDSISSIKNTVLSQGYNINALNTHTQAIDSTITGMQRYLDNNITATQNVQTQANTNTSNISSLQTTVQQQGTTIQSQGTTIQSQGTTIQSQGNDISTLKTQVATIQSQSTTNRLLGELVLIRKPTAWNNALPNFNIYIKNGIHYYVLTSNSCALPDDSRYYDYVRNYRGSVATVWMVQPQTPPSGYIYLETIYCP